jgi:signal transduction histidine kinase
VGGVDLTALAREVHELYEPLAEDKGIAIELDADPAGPVETLGNGQLLAQAIANLVDNAIKHTPPGSRVILRTRRGPEPAVEVADDGPGIPADQRERAKQRFVRLDAARSSVPGSGLGLSLVDAVAKLHDGRLELLDNEPGLKVRLSFRPVPAAATDEQQQQRSPPATTVPAGRTAVG